MNDTCCLFIPFLTLYKLRRRLFAQRLRDHDQ